MAADDEWTNAFDEYGFDDLEDIPFHNYYFSSEVKYVRLYIPDEKEPDFNTDVVSYARSDFTDGNQIEREEELDTATGNFKRLVVDTSDDPELAPQTRSLNADEMKSRNLVESGPIVWFKISTNSFEQFEIDNLKRIEFPLTWAHTQFEAIQNAVEDAGGENGPKNFALFRWMYGALARASVFRTEQDQELTGLPENVTLHMSREVGNLTNLLKEDDVDDFQDFESVLINRANLRTMRLFRNEFKKKVSLRVDGQITFRDRLKDLANLYDYEDEETNLRNTFAFGSLSMAAMCILMMVDTGLATDQCIWRICKIHESYVRSWNRQKDIINDDRDDVENLQDLTRVPDSD